MKKIQIILSLITISTLLEASNSELFKYGNNIDITAQSTIVNNNSLNSIVFKNPANILNINKKDGYTVNLFDINIEYSNNINTFVKDIKSSNTKKTEDILKIIDKNNGNNFNTNVNNFSGIAKNNENYAWGIGFINSSNINFQPHNGGSNGFIETSNRTYNILSFNSGKAFKSKYINNDINIGIGIKFIKSLTYRMNLSPTEILNNKDNLLTYLNNTYKKQNIYMTMDFGINYDIVFDSLKLKTGLSVNNIGQANYVKDYSRIPTTFNLGVAIVPTTTKYNLNKLSANFSYKDIFNNNKMITLDNNRILFNEDKDMFKRFIGTLNIEAYKNKYTSFIVKTGVYQKRLMIGTNLNLFSINLGALMYTENIGPDIGMLEDKRYLVNLGIRW